jgi:hypothetical protein
MLRVPGTGLTAPAVAGRGLSEGLGRTGERSLGVLSLQEPEAWLDGPKPKMRVFPPPLTRRRMADSVCLAADRRTDSNARLCGTGEEPAKRSLCTEAALVAEAEAVRATVRRGKRRASRDPESSGLGHGTKTRQTCVDARRMPEVGEAASLGLACAA